MTSQGEDHQIVVTIRPWPWREELIFDADGFRFEARDQGWFVDWIDITGITVHLERRTNPDGSDVWTHTIEFCPSSAEAATRPDMADFWKGDRFRMHLAQGEQATPEVERAVAKYRPDLWRVDTPEDNAATWFDLEWWLLK